MADLLGRPEDLKDDGGSLTDFRDVGVGRQAAPKTDADESAEPQIPAGWGGTFLMVDNNFFPDNSCLHLAPTLD